MALDRESLMRHELMGRLLLNFLKFTALVIVLILVADFFTHDTFHCIMLRGIGICYFW